MNRRQLAFLVAKIAVAAGVLAWLFHKVDAAQVWSGMRRAERAPLIAGALLCWFTVGIAGWRWHRLLAAFQIDIPLKSLICIAQIGQFFSMFLPGPAGDDLTRMLYISRLAKNRLGEACTTVVIDRLIGLASILLFAAICIPWQWQLLAVSGQIRWLVQAMLTGGITVAIFGALFFFGGHPTRRWFEHRLRSLPAHTLRDEIARIWGLLCANKTAVLQVAGAAISNQLLLCFVYYLACASIGLRGPLLAWFCFVPIVLAASAMPITVFGLGVREYLFILFLGVIAHASKESALAAAFIVLSMMFVVALSGGLLYIFYRPKSIPAVTAGPSDAPGLSPSKAPSPIDSTAP